MGATPPFLHMPLSPSSFFVAPAGVPFLMEDKYLRGGWRVVATLAERDAIAVSARKVGMRVLVADADMVEYQLRGGTGNGFWQVYAGGTGNGSIPEHQHPMTDITGLEDALNGKANSEHDHNPENITGLSNLLEGKANTVHEHEIADVNGLALELESKASSTHEHAMSEVTGLNTALHDKADTSVVEESLSGKADSTHSHGIPDVNGLTEVLADKASLTDLSEGLASKADSDHTHELETVNGLVDALAAKVDATAMATALAGKADTVHVHAIADTTGLQAALDAKAASVHTHTIAQTTGLQTALDAKFDKTGGTINGNLTVTGDLLIQGNNTVISTTELEVEDPIITLAKDNTSGVVPYAGIKIERGAADAFFVFNESTDRFTAYTSSNDLSTAGTLIDVQAANFYGALKGNADTATLAATATALATARSFIFTGDATGTGSFNGTGNVTIALTVADNSHDHTIANVTGLQTALDGKSDSSHTHADATTSASGFMSAADKTKLNGVAASANNYVHPTGDGNLHVPATSTTNNTRVLKAGATAGSAAWGQVAYSELSGIPSTFAPAAHVHAIADTTGLQTALDGKLATTGTAANSSQLQGFVTATGATINTVALRDGTGKITASDFTMTSDARLKTVIENINGDEALAAVLRWQAVRYRLHGQDRVMPGFVAQQIQKITPELVEDSAEYLSVSYALASAYFAAAIQTIASRLEKLENDTAPIR